eukprot:10430380-Lingulodinium_polyedra.AAC.1
MLRGDVALPRGATWERLLRGATIGRLRDALSRLRPVGRRGVASWNARWLGDPSAPLLAAKKRVLERLLDSETAVT